MKARTVMEVIDAAHLSRFVMSPYSQRGGIMLVAPPEALKSTLIELALEEYPDALPLSDLNARSLADIKSDLVSGRYNTIGFYDYAKLWERNISSALNVEGQIKSLVQEGFTKTAHQNPNMPALKARVMVVGAMTDSFYENKFKKWDESGFARRFLWCIYQMADSTVLGQAVHDWKLIDFDKDFVRRWPANKSIPYFEDEHFSRRLWSACRTQRGVSTPFVLLKKIYCVLIWKYKGDKDKAQNVLKDFLPSLSSDGAKLEL